MIRKRRLSWKGRLLTLLWLCCSSSLLLTSCSDDGLTTDNSDLRPYDFIDDIDSSVKPGDDFYQYAIGSWMAAHPRDEGLAGSMVEQEEKGMAWLRSIATTDCPDAAVAYVVKQWNLYKNNSELNKAMLKAKMDEVDNISNADEFVSVMAKLFQDGYSPFFALNKRIARKSYTFDLGTSIDYKVPSVVNELAEKGFPTVDYAVAQKASTQIADVLREAVATPEGDALVEKLKTQIGIPEGYLTIDDYSTESLRHLGAVIADPTQLESLKTCLKIVIVYRDLDIILLPDDSDLADIIGYKGKMSCLGYNIDQIFFSQKVRQSEVDNALKMCEELRYTFDQRLADNQWMNSATKAAAREKLAAMKFFCGSDKYFVEDYLLHAPTGKTYYENALQLRAEQCRLELHKLAGPGNDYKAYYDVVIYQPGYVANACYSQEYNSCYIPTSNLYYPASDPAMADSYNYGILGARIGHEMTHGFDEHGARCDMYGEEKNWWTDTDKSEFEDRTGKLAHYFCTIEVLPDVMCDPWSSTHEITADYGGLAIATQLFKRKLTDRGLTQEQVNEQMRNFFLSFAKGLSRNFSDEEVTEFNGGNSHPVPKARVNGNVALIPEWYEVFDVKPGEKLYHAPETRPVVW